MAFILTAELIIIGSLALWPRLRTTVQAKIASTGEGVAAAAGCARARCSRGLPSLRPAPDPSIEFRPTHRRHVASHGPPPLGD
jgi:hypothetical protein